MVRLSCFAHSLQLVINHAIKDQLEVNDVIKKVFSLASTLHSSTRMKDEFEASFGDCSILSACATRWNSFLLQIKAVYKLDACNLSRVLDRCGRSELDLEELDRERLKQLIIVLEPFLEATQATQGENVC